MDFLEEYFQLGEGDRSSSETSNLKLDLLTNGIDFVRSGVEHFFSYSDRRALKYAVLHLFAGLLLLFKERLSREHPSLIFKRPHEALKQDAKTIDFDEAIIGSMPAPASRSKTRTSGFYGERNGFETASNITLLTST